MNPHLRSAVRKVLTTCVGAGILLAGSAMANEAKADVGVQLKTGAAAIAVHHASGKGGADLQRFIDINKARQQVLAMASANQDRPGVKIGPNARVSGNIHVSGQGASVVIGGIDDDSPRAGLRR